ncbi:MAG TPA: TIM-barrel domain-containing protein, partial [Opitutus sp.]|nr:TIM-barrel domain-containing protein [Opitutus sp.]
MADPGQPGAKIDTLKGEHFVQMVEKLQALSIPVGVTWFEPPWQDARNSFVPNPAFSADLRGLVRQLEERGVRTLAWTVPYTTAEASNWKEAVGRGYLVRKPGTTVDGAKVKVTASGELEGRYYNMIDLFNPEAFAWWRAQIERSLETGIRGYKLDAGQDLPADALLHGGRRGADVHNSYAAEYSRVFFEALQKKYGDDFLMVPRAAWMGSSAFTNFKWPGDLSGSYANNGLPSSVYSSLSLAFSGFPFVSTDIGGFEDQPAPEHVWLRWAQFGAMLPGMQTLHMRWWYSEESLAHFRFLTWLHTDMTPLWMSLAHEAAATAAPICRPLVWSDQADVETWRVDDQFTVGESLLVAPLLNNNYDRAVYLPEGRWYDFWDNRETFVGPAHVTWFKGWFVKDKFPLYIKEGAIIPLEVINEFSGFGWPESSGFVTLAMWPRVRGVSEFTLQDTEAPVRITAEWGGDDVLTLGWSETRRNHLLRVHLDSSFGVGSVADSTGLLNRFDSLDAFRGGDEGWFHDRDTG